MKIGDFLPLKTLATFALVFTFIFGWRVYGFVDLIQIISVPFFIYYYSLRQSWSNRPAIAVTCAFFVMTIYGAIAVLMSGGKDPIILARVVRAWLTFGGALGIVAFAFSWLGLSRFDMFKYIFASLLAHAAIMISMYFFPYVRHAVYGLTGGVRFANAGVFLGVSAYDAGVRVMGFTYGLASTSLLQAIGLNMLPSLFHKVGLSSLILSSLFAITLAFSSLIAGRSGLVVFIALLIPFVIAVTASNGFSKSSKIVFLMSVFIGAVSSLVGWGMINILSASNMQIAYTLAHLRGIGDSLESGGIVEKLESMWILPSEPAQLLFGAGSFGRTESFYIDSDIGFVLQIYAYGVIGTMLFWLPIVIMATSALTRSKRAFPIVLPFLMSVVAAVIFAGKEEALYERCFWSVQSLLWALVIVRHPRM